MTRADLDWYEWPVQCEDCGDYDHNDDHDDEEEPDICGMPWDPCHDDGVEPTTLDEMVTGAWGWSTDG